MMTYHLISRLAEFDSVCQGVNSRLQRGLSVKLSEHIHVTRVDQFIFLFVLSGKDLRSTATAPVTLLRHIVDKSHVLVDKIYR